MVFAIVTGGGTSGHVIPAMAIIESLLDAGHGPEEIVYVGCRRGVESTMVPALGVQCAYLPVTGLQRSVRGMLRNVTFPFRLAWSTAAARRLVRRVRPRVVVSVGGYASEPTARAAVSAGVPLVCVSYDRVPGLATRRQSRRAAVCAVAFEGTGLPRAVVTGAPVRRAARRMDVATVRASARAALGVGDGTLLVTVVGGSLGSAALNSAVGTIAGSLAAAGTAAVVHHVTGRRFGDGAAPSYRTGNVRVETVQHEDDMPAVMAATDILVSRAGASTVAEIATIGVTSILVPWPGAAADHQSKNASWLGDAGACIVVEEDDSLAARLAREVVGLSSDPPARAAIAERARQMGAVNRGSALVDVITDAARQ